ncbi:ABC transporter substrate binding protein [Halarcobacter bivalviorum]|uniref:histidine kinase n=1 Tax=Halarcobacter bivalviorum TaxID=663364 RepID=A0AAX2A8A9_9BACT|nr:ABC transporter substrate binding protein [Halarcobacter bivalviorum]AXH11112.1 PAS sensor-containing two-component system histidine kinase [Halarcobacter bivalviorum]RXK09700.1 histidine kinase [Halarcobacter bivalviorum]
MRLILILFLLFTSLFASKEVLLLHSYHKGYKWSDDISSEIEKRFKNEKDIDLTTIYMDTKHVASPLYLNKLAQLYKEQFSTRDFDIIIASDNNAFEFAIRYHEYLFKDLPVLFCGINNFDRAFLGENNMKNYMSGVVEQVDLEKNFELISKIHPNLEKLLIINDKSKTGLAVKRDLRPVIEKYSQKFKIEYVDNLDIDNLKKKVINLDKTKSALLFVLLFKDKTGKFFTYKQSFKKVREVSQVPIYGLWDFYLDYGMVGGLLTSAKAQGEAVANMTIQVLNGKDVKTIPIIEKSPNRYIFDYKELDRFDINIDKILEDYEVINEPHGFFRKYTKLVVVTLIIIAILLIMVFSMKANIQRRMRVEKDLQNRIKFDKVLLDTLPNPIYYKNKDGKFLGCNKAFSELLNIPKKDVVGKTAKDFFAADIAARNETVDRKLLHSLGTDTSEVTLHLADNQMRHIIIKKAVYLNNDSSIGGIVCIMDDITERIQQKQFLIQQGKLAEMGDMVAAIAHQWNEPLVELSAQVQDIQTSFILNELKDSQVQEFVNDSMVQIKYMSQTLSDFRNFLKPSTKKVFFSIKQSFEEIFEIIGKQIFYSNINMRVNYNYKEDDLIIFGYENEFKQVLLNLINNAKNKIIDKNTNDKYNLTINVEESEKYNIIEIIDDGGNIDSNIIDKIFEPYFTTKKRGTGFGLYMAKVIIEDKMKGHITAQNRDKNVVFTIKLPKKEAKNENSTIRR